MKQNKEIDPQTIKEVFPDDEELYNKFTEMKADKGNVSTKKE